MLQWTACNIPGMLQWNVAVDSLQHSWNVAVDSLQHSLEKYKTKAVIMPLVGI
jgi:hypothetical protein